MSQKEQSYSSENFVEPAGLSPEERRAWRQEQMRHLSPEERQKWKQAYKQREQQLVKNSDGQKPSLNGSQGNETLTHRTLDSMFWAFSGYGFEAVSRLVVLMVLSRLLTPQDFGIASAALMVITFSEFFTQLGVGPAIVQLPKLEPRHIRTGFTFSTFLGLLMMGLIWVLAPFIADFFRMPELTPYLRVLGLAFPSYGLSTVAMSLLMRDLQFKRLTVREAVSYFIGYAVVGISLAWLGFGAWALIAASLVQTNLNNVFLLMIQPHPKRPQLELQAFKELIYFGSGLTIARLFKYFAERGDNIVVARGLGAEALGLYVRAYALMTTSKTLFGQVMDRVLFASMAKVQDDPRRLARVYLRGSTLVAVIFLPVGAALWILAPEFIRVLLGPAWGEAVVPFQILALGMFLYTSFRMSSNVFKATGSVYSLAGQQAIGMVLIIGGAWIGHYWGLEGVAVGVVAAMTIYFFFLARLSLQLTLLTWREFFAAHIPGVVLAVIVYVEVGVVATGLRNLNTPALLVLLISVLTTAVMLLGLLWFAPKAILGTQGMWLLETLIEYIPGKFGLFRQLRKKFKNRLAPAQSGEL